ncbi:unnamed protein product, partial [Musa acuminata var. zebrina]
YADVIATQVAARLDDYAEVFGDLAGSWSIPLFDLPPAADGWSSGAWPLESSWLPTRRCLRCRREEAYSSNGRSGFDISVGCWHHAWVPRILLPEEKRHHKGIPFDVELCCLPTLLQQVQPRKIFAIRELITDNNLYKIVDLWWYLGEQLLMELTIVDCII